MYSFNIVITESCNANCSHCYMNAAAGRKRTFSKTQIDELTQKLPDSTKSVVLTGGEVYLCKDLLFYTIDKLREKFPDIIIGVESNGKYFYENESSIKGELKLLEEHGLNFIRFSDDVFHADGGIDLEKVRAIKDYGEGLDLEIKYLVQEDALPIGKAEKLEEKYQGKRECMNSHKSYENPYLFIDIEGNIYSCAWKCIPPIGNIFNEDFINIEKKLYSGIQKDLLIGNIDKLISENSECQKIKEKRGTCMACHELFKDQKGLSNDSPFR